MLVSVTHQIMYSTEKSFVAYLIHHWSMSIKHIMPLSHMALNHVYFSHLYCIVLTKISKTSSAIITILLYLQAICSSICVLLSHLFSNNCSSDNIRLCFYSFSSFSVYHVSTYSVFQVRPWQLLGCIFKRAGRRN